MASNDKVQFTIRVDMQRRWVPYFLGMLKTMQRLGGWGSSRQLGFYSDGDGDFRPKFEWDTPIEIVEGKQGHNDCSPDYCWDAG